MKLKRGWGQCKGWEGVGLGLKMNEETVCWQGTVTMKFQTPWVIYLENKFLWMFSQGYFYCCQAWHEMNEKICKNTKLLEKAQQRFVEIRACWCYFLLFKHFCWKWLLKYSLLSHLDEIKVILHLACVFITAILLLPLDHTLIKLT